MSKKFTLLAVLWIAAAFVAPPATSADAPASTADTSPATDAATSPAAATTTTKAPGPSSDTEAPTKDPGATSTPSISPTTKPQNPCASNPCGDGSTCEPRAGQTFVCLCLFGESYNATTKICNKAKVFPGKVQLTDRAYTEELKDKTSAKFKEASDEITKALEEGLSKEPANQYVGSTVREFLEVGSGSKSTRNTKAEASVEITYTSTSPVTQETMKKELESIICETCPLKGSFASSEPCDSNACDVTTTDCASTDGTSFTCDCKDGYIKTDYSERVCLACPSGQKAEDSNCVQCSFGYSGFNCGENWKLVLVIVGSVLGGLLLITLIVLPVVALKSPKKKSKKNKNEDIGKPYVSHSPAKAPLVNSSFVNRPTTPVTGPANGQAGNIGVPRIPRATSNNNWDNRNNLEMTSSNSPYSQNRPQSNPYAQSRPQSNPYAQNRASVNPYAERQGHSNPYYTHDDGRRF